MKTDNLSAFPPVPMWRVHALRFAYVLMAFVMGFFVWMQILFESADWGPPMVVSKSMLGALALLSLLALKYPLQMLPLMLFEVAWKTVALLLIIFPAWLDGRLTPANYQLFTECIGIALVYLVMPWRHIWARFIRQPAEPWRKQPSK